MVRFGVTKTRRWVVQQLLHPNSAKHMKLVPLIETRVELAGVSFAEVFRLLQFFQLDHQLQIHFELLFVVALRLAHFVFPFVIHNVRSPCTKV